MTYELRIINTYKYDKCDEFFCRLSMVISCSMHKYAMSSQAAIGMPPPPPLSGVPAGGNQWSAKMVIGGLQPVVNGG